MNKHPMALDSTLVDHIALNAHAMKNPDAFGIEVELEGSNIITADPAIASLWAQHDDHSLRKHHGQSVEYVFRAPYNLKDTTKAVDLLFDYLNKANVKVAPSYRTSIHVHINFATETFRTIYNFITLCMILDELLVSQNGDHRIGNNFCLRVRDAMGQADSLIKSVQAGSEFFALNQNERYSSINFASLLKFGSIEFRSLECTTHKGRLMHWIGTLDYMKKVSKEFKNPQDIISQFSRMGAKEFLFMVLGPYAIKYGSIPRMEQMIHSGMRIAQDFAFCSQWVNREAGQKKPTIKANKVAYGAIGIGDFPDWAIYNAAPPPQAPMELVQADPLGHLNIQPHVEEVDFDDDHDEDEDFEP